MCWVRRSSWFTATTSPTAPKRRSPRSPLWIKASSQCWVLTAPACRWRGGEVFAESEIPALTATATNPTVTLDCEWYARICFIDPFQGTMLARYAVKNDYKKIAIMREKDSEYAVGLVKYFQDEIATHDGFEVVELCDFMNKDEDFSALLGAVLAQSPDVIFTSVSYADKAAQIMKQARALGYEGAFFGGDTLDAPELYSIAGDAAVGSVFTTFYDAAQPATEKTSEFLDAYRAKYGKEPAAPTVMAYDAYLTMRNAIETAGTTDAEAVRDALFATDGFVGAAGTITLDENHDAVRPGGLQGCRSRRFHGLQGHDRAVSGLSLSIFLSRGGGRFFVYLKRNPKGDTAHV